MKHSHCIAMTEPSSYFVYNLGSTSSNGCSYISSYEVSELIWGIHWQLMVHVPSCSNFEHYKFLLSFSWHLHWSLYWELTWMGFVDQFYLRVQLAIGNPVKNMLSLFPSIFSEFGPYHRFSKIKFGLTEDFLKCISVMNFISHCILFSKKNIVYTLTYNFRLFKVVAAGSKILSFLFICYFPYFNIRE